MAFSISFDPQLLRKLCGGVLSVALHLALLLAILSGGRHDGIHSGDVPTLQVVLVEARKADQREGLELPPLPPAIPTEPSAEQLQAAIAKPAAASLDALPAEPRQPALSGEQPEPLEPIAISVSEIPSSRALPHAEKTALAQRLERLAEESLDAARAEVSWEQDGKRYSAVLIRERANDGTALERVTAEVSASDRGKRLTTRVHLQRLAFSQFTQMVDHWDPLVQLHDDEIAGRFHSNSRFNLMSDRHAAPKFLGKVTTSARSFSAESRSRRRESEIFRGGVQTRAGRIDLPESLRPFDWAPRDERARIHELAGDVRIRFFADGSYTWRNRDSKETHYRSEPSEHPVYFVAAPAATLYVAGVVAGRVLVYSPHRIVIEGNLTYASDPRTTPGSRDYLGLVSDKYVEVAGPSVTGPGDLEIHAAIFAGRRFVVRHIDHPRSATLRIYGSLAAGTLSATEPRYATKIDYDTRFERQRPPGFPSTNRHEVADWDGQWTEAPERTAGDSF